MPGGDIPHVGAGTLLECASILLLVSCIVACSTRNHAVRGVEAVERRLQALASILARWYETWLTG